MMLEPKQQHWGEEVKAPGDGGPTTTTSSFHSASSSASLNDDLESGRLVGWVVVCGWGCLGGYIAELAGSIVCGLVLCYVDARTDLPPYTYPPTI